MYSVSANINYMPYHNANCVVAKSAAFSLYTPFVYRWSAKTSAPGDNRGDAHSSSHTRIPVSCVCNCCG